VTDPKSQVTTYTYAADDALLQTVYTNATIATPTVSFTYDPAYPRVATMADAVGNILTWQQQADSNAPTVFRYGYDRADELVAATKWTTDQTPAVLKRYAYAYDFGGNRTSEQIDDAITGATYDAMNRLVSQQAAGGLLFAGTLNEPATVTVGGKPATVNPDNSFSATVPVATGTNTVPIVATDPSGNVRTSQYQVTSSGPTTNYAYDANGSLTADGTRTLEWDARNQLLAINVGSHRSEFTYDGLQRRVREIEKENNIVQSDTRVIWCGEQVCEERAADGISVTRRLFALGEQVGGSAATLSNQRFSRQCARRNRWIVDALGTLCRRSVGSENACLRR
jgi:YD repeat-containing protein